MSWLSASHNSDIRSFVSHPLYIQYVTEPGDSCGKINPFLPTRCRPTVEHSLAAGNAQPQWLQAYLPDGPYGAMPVLCLLSLISRNSPKQLGMVSPELPRGVTEVASHLDAGETVDEEGAEGLVLAMGGVGGFEEDLGEVR